jgi:hypothetical protein
MKYLITVIAVISIAFAGVQTGIGIGFSIEDNPEPVPMLSVGYQTGSLYSLSIHGAVVGYSDSWDPVAMAAVGFGPVRLGICHDSEQWGSYVGFEAPLTDQGGIVSRVLNVEGMPTYSVTGLYLNL